MKTNATVTVNFDDDDYLRLTLKTVKDVERLQAAILALFQPIDSKSKPILCQETQELSLEDWILQVEIAINTSPDYGFSRPYKILENSDMQVITYELAFKDNAFLRLTDSQLEDIKDGKDNSYVWRYVEE